MNRFKKSKYVYCFFVTVLLVCSLSDDLFKYNFDKIRRWNISLVDSFVQTPFQCLFCQIIDLAFYTNI